MRDIKFVSYNGIFPNLCSGTLVLSVDGNTVSEKYCLVSGVNVHFGIDYDYVEYG